MFVATPWKQFLPEIDRLMRCCAAASLNHSSPRYCASLFRHGIRVPFHYVGTLEGHRNWVTGIASTFEQSNLVVSSSRDKTLMIWELTPESENPGYARRSLHGHGECVASCVLSSDGQYALSGSWDKTMRLWDLNTGATVRTFKGHTKDVNSVAFSGDNRQIVSGSRDKTIKLWNTLAECKYTIMEDMHTDWVSSVGFSPSAKMPLIVSAGWDKLVKVWNLSNCKLRTNLVGHTGVVYTTTVSPDGSLCASGGKDGTVMLWDVNEGKHLYSLDAGGTINALTFSPRKLLADRGHRHHHPRVGLGEQADLGRAYRHQPPQERPALVRLLVLER